MKKIITLSVMVMMFVVVMTMSVFVAAANVSLDLNEGTLSGNLDTGNGVLIGEATLDLTNVEITESHCLDTKGHTSEDLR